MKRVILRVVVMLVTFALGIGVYWLLIERGVNVIPSTASVEAVSPAPVAPPVAPVVPVATAQPLPVATPKPHIILDYDPEMFNPYGVYYLMDPKPKEFAKVESISLGVFGSGHDDGGYIAVSTRNEYDTYFESSAVFALITPRRVIIATSETPGSGVEYRFEGEFLRTDFNAVAESNTPVLRGVLTRSKNGQTLAERTVSFRFEHLGC